MRVGCQLHFGGWSVDVPPKTIVECRPRGGAARVRQQRAGGKFRREELRVHLSNGLHPWTGDAVGLSFDASPLRAVIEAVAVLLDRMTAPGDPLVSGAQLLFGTRLVP